jgi:hypothetical protein
MPLKLRPTGLGSGIDKDRPDYTVFCGGWEVGRIYQDPRRSRQSALVLVADRQRSDDALGPRGDARRGQGAVSEELGRLEGVGEAGGGALRPYECVQSQMLRSARKNPSDSKKGSSPSKGVIASGDNKLLKSG